MDIYCYLFSKYLGMSQRCRIFAPMKMKNPLPLRVARLVWAAATLALMPALTAVAQQGAARGSGSTAPGDTLTVEDNPCIFPDDHRYCWTLDPITAIRYDAVPDTGYIGQARVDVMESKALAIAHTGNLWSPHIVQDYFARPAERDFLFVNAYQLFAHAPARTLYYNTRIPYTMAAYTTSGRSLDANDHLRLAFAGNFNKDLGLGSTLDYVYARGAYQNSATKPLKWESYLYYLGEQYKAYIAFDVSKYANQENGGIADRGYVLTPEDYNDNFTDPANMPTRLLDTWNETNHRNVHFTHTYDLGRWEERIAPDDSTDVWDEFVPVATLFHTVDYDHMDHQFRMDRGADATDEGLYTHHYINRETTSDTTDYHSLTTYAGIRVNEGFSRWSQFGLSAFVGYERQHYRLMQDTLDAAFIPRSHTSNTLWLGGQLSRHQGSALNFDITARTALSGDKVGDFDLTGRIRTVIPFGRRDSEGRRTDSLIVDATGLVRNSRVSYLTDHYFSNHFRWSNDFDREQHLRVAGEIAYPRSRTSVSAGVEHINNFHYFAASDGLPHQYDRQLDIFGLTVRQGLHVRMGKRSGLLWDNAVLVQTSTDDAVLALPKVSLESDLSLYIPIAALQLQLGATGYWYTKYYAPYYEPATQTFQTQHDIECGGYPMLNAYVNCNLKRIKFYLQMTNVLQGTVTNDAFLGPNYPTLPRRFMWGVIFNLQN